jgi:hypothetical protein
MLGCSQQCASQHMTLEHLLRKKPSPQQEVSQQPFLHAYGSSTSLSSVEDNLDYPAFALGLGSLLGVFKDV